MFEIFKKINELILTSNNILLVTHPRPDGDALGSTCAMIGYFKSLKKNYRAYCIDPVPKNFSFLPWQEEILNNYTTLSDFKPELVFFLDLWERSRSNIAGYLNRLSRNSYKLIILDHHLPGDFIVDLSYINPRCSSTSEIIFHFFKKINFNFDKQTANSLLTGILTDTQNFTNQATKDITLQVSEKLIKRGANINKLTRITWKSRGFNDLKLLGLAFERLNLNQTYNLMVTIIKQADIKRLSFNDEASLDFANFLKGTVQGKAVLILNETISQIKGSLRSISPEVDVAKLARFLGGGGHRLAAGFTLNGQLVWAKNQWQVI